MAIMSLAGADGEVVAETQARHLRELEEMTVDLIQVMTGDEHPEVDYVFVLPESVQNHLDHAQQLREESANAPLGFPRAMIDTWAGVTI